MSYREVLFPCAHLKPPKITKHAKADIQNRSHGNCQRNLRLHSGLWRLSRESAEHAKYAFAIYKGEIKEVYEIEYRLPATKAFSHFWIEKLKTQGRTIHPDEHVGRYEFIGHLAPEDIRKRYRAHKTPKRHSGNPIMYFNCYSKVAHGMVALCGQNLREFGKYSLAKNDGFYTATVRLLR